MALLSASSSGKLLRQALRHTSLPGLLFKLDDPSLRRLANLLTPGSEQQVLRSLGGSCTPTFLHLITAQRWLFPRR